MRRRTRFAQIFPGRRGAAMETRRCAACDKAFRPRSQVRDQTYCSALTCQRVRRRRWQRAKRQRDADYRENQARGAARVGSTPSRLLARISAHASPVLREQSPCGATAATQATAVRGAVCKDGRINGVFARAFRDLSAGAGECRRVCKDGRVDCGNDFDIKAMRGSGGGLQREDVIGAAGLRC